MHQHFSSMHNVVRSRRRMWMWMKQFSEPEIWSQISGTYKMENYYSSHGVLKSHMHVRMNKRAIGKCLGEHIGNVVFWWYSCPPTHWNTTIQWKNLSLLAQFMAALYYKYSKHMRVTHIYHTMLKKKNIVTVKNNKATICCADVIWSVLFQICPCSLLP